MTSPDAIPSVSDFASLMYSVPLRDAGAILHLGRTKLYEMLGSGRLRAVKDGGRVMVLVDSIREYQRSLPQATFAPPKPPRLGHLDRLHAKQRRAQARRRRRGK